MTKDYARQPTKARSSLRRGSKKKSNNNVWSPWLVFLAGVFLGVLIIPLSKLSEISNEQNPARTNNNLTDLSDGKQKIPQFNFYTLLKEAEVMVTETPKITTLSSKEHNSNEIFLLQTGSFGTEVEADNLRAQLLLLNLNTVIEKIISNKNEEWHRVIVGPFSNPSALAEARKILADNRIEPLLLKRKSQLPSR
ncbi:MAG: cell division protein FtsN [Porticoccus sp.]|jgi:cell division protein FtsN